MVSHMGDSVSLPLLGWGVRWGLGEVMWGLGGIGGSHRVMPKLNSTRVEMVSHMGDSVSLPLLGWGG